MDKIIRVIILNENIIVKINTSTELMINKIPVNKKCKLSTLVDCGQPATTANFEYSGSLGDYTSRR